MLNDRESVSVIIPCYDNESSLAELHQRLSVSLQPLSLRYEIVFIDDGSRDNTNLILDRIARHDSAVRVISLSRNFGQHPAISAGLSQAQGDLIVLMDADLQDQPEEIPRLIDVIRNDHTVDMVFTSSAKSGGNTTKTSSRLFHQVFSRISQNDIPPNIGTFRIFTRRIRDALLAYQERSVVYGPLMAQLGFGFRVLQVVRSGPVGRKTSYSFAKRVRLAVEATLYYGSSFPKLILGLGVGLVSISALYLMLVAVTYALGQRSLPAGTILLLSVLLLTSGVILLSTGLLSLYVIQIFREVLHRPRYHIASLHGEGLSGGSS